MNNELLKKILCPICKQPLELDKAAQELICTSDQLAFPIRDGIPVMLVAQARSLKSSS